MIVLNHLPVGVTKAGVIKAEHTKGKTCWGGTYYDWCTQPGDWEHLEGLCEKHHEEIFGAG